MSESTSSKVDNFSCKAQQKLIKEKSYAEPPPRDEELPAETITRRLKLYRAALNGDWAVAKEIYDKYKDEIGVKITSHGNTALHVAAQANRPDFVKELVKMMKTEDIAEKNFLGCTALFYAAASGSVELAKEMMKDNRNIATLPDNDGMLPIVRAASLGKEEMVVFLYEQTKDLLTAHDCFELLLQLIESGLYAQANHIDFVKELVKMMNAKDIAETNNKGCTALFYAAASGSVELAKETMKDNKIIAMLPDYKDEILPIVRAASLGKEEMVVFLYEQTKDFLSDDDCIELLVKLIETDLYAVALQLLHDRPRLATKRAKKKENEDNKENKKGEKENEENKENKKGEKENEENKEGETANKENKEGETALHVLARKNLTSSNQPPRGTFQRYFNLGAKDRKNKEAVKLVESLWEEVIFLSEREIFKLIEQPRDLILDAANHGNVQFLSILIREYPDLMWKQDEKDKYTIFHMAVLNRQGELFKFIHDIKSIADMMVDSKDGEGNNILHLAGKLAPQHRLNAVAGSALQMQRELLWFEAVKEVVPPKLGDARNNEGLTPGALFSKEHKKLMSKGETWMKETASSCMIVATLIATIVFAAAITVPGGNKEDTGHPFFCQKASFKIFAVSKVISLAVKNVVPPNLDDVNNNEELTSEASFSEEHKELKRKGERWMKNTASSCKIVATLIATIVFAAAITVPGGNKEGTGLPFFRQKASFKIFAVSNVISLIASSVSIVNFLSIVTPRYAEEDFLHSLPRKLLVGFATLFIAIAAMMVVFSATSYIVFKDGSLWIAILAIVISSMPVILFVKQHFLFFKDVLRSTYASDYLIRKGKTSIFHKEGETKVKQQKKTKQFNGSNLTIPLTSSCSTNV